jgi:toxin ParE1/3/4
MSSKKFAGVMLYLVELSDRAARDIDNLYEEKNAGESLAAARWFNGLEKAVFTLASQPDRCPAAPESTPSKPLRHLFFGKTPHIYRVIYEIDKRTKLVRILTIRHGAMDLAGEVE